VFGDPVYTKKFGILPTRIVPLSYQSAVHVLKDGFSKKQRKAIRYAENCGHKVVEMGWEQAMPITVQHKKPWVEDYPKAFKALSDAGAKFFICNDASGEHIGGLTMFYGEKWCVEMAAWGEQDLIKATAMSEAQSRGFEYYDLAGLTKGRDDKENEINRFKLKWGEPAEVRLVVKK
jgi:hypothetical protein